MPNGGKGKGKGALPEEPKELSIGLEMAAELLLEVGGVGALLLERGDKP